MYGEKRWVSTLYSLLWKLHLDWTKNYIMLVPVSLIYKLYSTLPISSAMASQPISSVPILLINHEHTTDRIGHLKALCLHNSPIIDAKALFPNALPRLKLSIWSAIHWTSK